MNDIIANDNSNGQFYVEIKEGDKAFETHCDVTLLSQPLTPVATFPQKIEEGMYLVNVDIQPGLYKGLADSETCYWARLKDAAGTLDSIIANDNAEGQFYIEVGSTDYALDVACAVELASN